MSLKSFEKVETNVYSVEISISAQQLQDAKLKAYNKAKKNIAIPGFRKGKVPKMMIEKMYGVSFFYEDALDILYPDVVSEAIEEAKLEIVDAPFDVKVDKIDEDGAEMTIKVTVKPEVELGEYKGLKAEKEPTEVTDAEVDAEIAQMRERNARIVDASEREVKDGDITNINFEGFVDGVAFDGGKGEEFDLTIGSGQFIPGFEEQIIGHKIDEEFDVNVTFPEQYVENLAGKAATFKVKVNSIKEKQLPELDDEFAKDVSEFDTVDELKKDIMEKKTADKERSSKEKFESDLLTQVADGIKAEIPPVMIENKAKELVQNAEQQMAQQGLSMDIYLQYMGIAKEQYLEDAKVQAEKQVKTRLALEKIVEVEKIEVTDEDIDKEYQKYAEMYKMEVEELKKFIPADGLKDDLAIGKAVDFIVEKAVEGKPAAKKPAAKKATASTAKKTTAKKAEDGEEKKPATKKTTSSTAKKTTAKKAEDGEEKKPAAKKTASSTAKKTTSTAKKTTAKKADAE